MDSWLMYYNLNFSDYRIYSKYSDTFTPPYRIHPKYSDTLIPYYRIKLKYSDTLTPITLKYWTLLLLTSVLTLSIRKP